MLIDFVYLYSHLQMMLFSKSIITVPEMHTIRTALWSFFKTIVVHTLPIEQRPRWILLKE